MNHFQLVFVTASVCCVVALVYPTIVEAQHNPRIKQCQPAATSSAVQVVSKTRTCCNGEEICFETPGQSGHIIFPGKPSVGAGSQDVLTVVARLCVPDSKGKQIFFRAIDVDDRTSDVAPVDPNGSEGNDNRGRVKCGNSMRNEGCLLDSDGDGVASAVTDSSGLVRLRFRVTRQPGDNFRIIAARNRGRATSGRGTQSSDILVWRKLHVFFASMDKPELEQVLVQIEKVERHTHTTRLLLTGDLRLPPYDMHGSTPAPSAEIGRYAGGKLLAYRSGSSTPQVFRVQKDKVINEKSKLILHNDKGRPFPIDIKNYRFLLQDDDVAEIKVPINEAKLRSAFATACIKPVIRKLPRSPVVPFRLHLSRKQIVSELKKWQDQVPAVNKLDDPDYWTATILKGFQFTRKPEPPAVCADADSNPKEPTPACRGKAMKCRKGVFIAAEDIRDWLGQPRAKHHPHWHNILNHEIGHLFGLEHTFGNDVQSRHLMGVTKNRRYPYFHERNIAKMRCTLALPDEPHSAGCPKPTRRTKTCLDLQR